MCLDINNKLREKEGIAP